MKMRVYRIFMKAAPPPALVSAEKVEIIVIDTENASLFSLITLVNSLIPTTSNPYKVRLPFVSRFRYIGVKLNYAFNIAASSPPKYFTNILYL
jgi:hypothetical protein